ncbi:MAG: YidC/Oxa1 family membrane protein insertase, partial [Lachnospiraceae bacterium]|nr:YidC/Oxa1 family membrane protein insertase [Lachnospiraceae bacterium]
NPNQIIELGKEFGGSVQTVLGNQMNAINEMNSFCGMNLATAPNVNGLRFLVDGKFNVYLLIPILAFLTQFISSKLMQAMQDTTKIKKQNDEDNPMAGSMKTMMITMPIISAIFTWGFATGLGIYWIASAGILCLQQLVINMQLKNMDMDKLIKQNIEKANKKREKKGLPLLNTDVTVNSIKKQAEKAMEKEKNRENILKNQATMQVNNQEFYFGDESNPDSLFAKANMVKKYNEKHGDK